MEETHAKKLARELSNDLHNLMEAPEVVVTPENLLRFLECTLRLKRIASQFLRPKEVLEHEVESRLKKAKECLYFFKEEPGRIAARGLVIHDIVDRGSAIIESPWSEDDAERWSLDVIQLALLAEWLPNEVEREIRQVLDLCVAMVEGHPEVFATAFDVMDHDDSWVSRTSEPFIEALRRAPMQAATDHAAEGHVATPHARDALKRALHKPT